MIFRKHGWLCEVKNCQNRSVNVVSMVRCHESIGSYPAFNCLCEKHTEHCKKEYEVSEVMVMVGNEPAMVM